MIKIVLVLVLFMFSCEQECDVNSDIITLKNQRKVLTEQVSLLNSEVESSKSKISQLNVVIKSKKESLSEIDIYLDGKEPLYVLSLELSQSHFSLSIKKHIKDAMNAIEFDLPVGRSLYNKVNVGDVIVDDFRVGSFIMSGSFGDWKMKVKKKFIKTP